MAAVLIASSRVPMLPPTTLMDRSAALIALSPSTSVTEPAPRERDTSPSVLALTLSTSKSPVFTVRSISPPSALVKIRTLVAVVSPLVLMVIGPSPAITSWSSTPLCSAMSMLVPALARKIFASVSTASPRPIAVAASRTTVSAVTAATVASSRMPPPIAETVAVAVPARISPTVTEPSAVKVTSSLVVTMRVAVIEPPFGSAVSTETEPSATILLRVMSSASRTQVSPATPGLLVPVALTISRVATSVSTGMPLVPTCAASLMTSRLALMSVLLSPSSLMPVPALS